MDTRLSMSSYLLIGSMLFGLFFGAGNLIFPVHMGQLAGGQMVPATLGFLLTAIGLPFFGVVAIGLSGGRGFFDLASRVHPWFGYFMTVALYLTIGPLFALPRTGTVSYEIGLAPFVPEEFSRLGLALFTASFFLVALFFALRPGQLLFWVGKVLNPLFLACLAVLIVAGFLFPLGTVSTIPAAAEYTTLPFFKGFIEGYDTMDALASLVFGILVVQALKNLGVTSPKGITLGMIKAGAVSVLLMGVIYTCLAYLGASSAGRFAISSNGGIALAQISRHYLGLGGSVLLAAIVTFACLKTAIGLIIACSEAFTLIFPKSFNYRTYCIFFTLVAALIANLGLTQIIAFSKPVLMFLYPLAIALIILGLLSPIFRHHQLVYHMTIAGAMLISSVDCLNKMPEVVRSLPIIAKLLGVYSRYVPFFDIGMGWVVPMLAGCLIGWGFSVWRQYRHYASR